MNTITTQPRQYLPVNDHDPLNNDSTVIERNILEKILKALDSQDLLNTRGKKLYSQPSAIKQFVQKYLCYFTDADNSNIYAAKDNILWSTSMVPSACENAGATFGTITITLSLIYACGFLGSEIRNCLNDNEKTKLTNDVRQYLAKDLLKCRIEDLPYSKNDSLFLKNFSDFFYYLIKNDIIKCEIGEINLKNNNIFDKPETLKYIENNNCILEQFLENNQHLITKSRSR